MNLYFDTQTFGLGPLAKMKADKIVMVCNHFLFEFKDWIHRQKEDQIDGCVRKRRTQYLPSDEKGSASSRKPTQAEPG